MRISIVSHSDIAGGAARAAHRLHGALLASGLESRMQVSFKHSDSATIAGPDTVVGRTWNILRPGLGHAILRLQRSADREWRSAAFFPGFAVPRILGLAPDVVNLHWVGSETLSIGEIARLARLRPVLWTAHDMWPFCGTEHYADDGSSARWRRGYSADSRPSAQSGLDMDRWTWRRKATSWRDLPPVRLVTPSRWLADCAAGSSLMQSWPATVVPNVLDTDHFRPMPRDAARSSLDLPADGSLLLFGGGGGLEAHRKGWDLLAEALAHLASTPNDLRCAIIGQERPVHPPDLGLPTSWLGTVRDDAMLARLYAAADVTVVPSRQDNLPQMGTEAQACGCPVAAFDTCGLADVVEHQRTGYLARPFDAAELAHGIRWILADAERHARLRDASRRRAEALWSAAVVVPQYVGAYRQAIDDYRRWGMQ